MFIVFTKGEIIMNNIYKVIWSKAKNCYVVASEIARSHTKSATGSEKIGGVTRRSLLASLMALSLLCGGLGVAEAAVVHVNEVDGGTSAVYTTDETYTQKEVDLALAEKGAAKDVAINTAAIADLKKAVGDAGSGLTKEVADQKAAIATNTENLNTNNAAIKSLDGKLANLTTAVDGKANEADVNTKLAKKADATSVFTKDEVNTKLTDYAKSDDVYTKTAADGKFATSAALNTAKTDLEGEITTAKNELDGKITANTAKITANETAIQKLNAKAGTTETTLNDLSDRMVVAENNITDLKDADVRLEGKIDQNANDINGLKDKDVELSGKINDNKNLIDQNKTNIAKNAADITNINGKLTTAEGNIQTNTDNINALDKKVGTINNGTYLDGTASVADNLGKLDAGLKQEVEDRKAADTALSGRIDANANTIAKVNQELVNTNNHFNTELRKTNDHFNAELGKTNAALQEEGKARAEADAKINTKIGNIDDTRTEYVKNANSISQNLTTLDEKLQATNDRTGGIKRNTEDTQTTIEDKVTVNRSGDVGGVKGLSAETINTTGDVAIGGALNVTGASDLKGDVTLGTPNGANTVTVNGKADFNEAANMNKGLNVTSGDTDLKNTTVDGTLSVNKETTLKKTDVDGALTVEGEATFKDKVTMENDLEVKGELKTDKIAMENKKTDTDGTIHRSATTITADGITHIGEVEKSGEITKSQFTHTKEGSETYAKKGNTANWTETRSDVKADGVTTKVEDSKKNRTNTSQAADGIKGYATDKDGNKTYTKVTATENSFQVQDKNGDNKNHQVNTMGSSVTEIKNDEGKTTKTEQTAENITNTAKDGTIKNDAKDIVNNASGNISNKSQTMDTTVTGKATESYGSLDTTVNGNETHIVKGTKTETVDGKVTENYNAGQATKVTGNQDIHVTGKQTNTVEGGQENIISGGQINSITGDQTTTVTGDISNKAENITNEANTKLTDKVGDNTRVLDSEGITDTVPGADGKGSTFKQRIDAIMGNVKTDAGESEVTQKGDEITSVVGKGEATNSRVTQKKNLLETAVTDGTNYNISNDTANASAKELTDGTKVNKLQDNLDSSEKTITNGTYKTSKLQTALDITNTAKDGTITNDAKDIVNNASGNMTNTVGGDLKTTVSGNELHEVTGTKTENVTGKVTENYGNGQETNVTGDQNIHVTGKQTNKIDGNQENTIGGNQTTTVTGDISNKAKNITNEASNSITDKVGDHTRVLDSDGITDTVGGSTFKQRIDKIMMESKDVSIKAEETLTNEAKVITNKASEVINNEAININNTATGIITSKASEIKNQADKLISNKVGENTWENMENGKITTSIKDGAKQNLTQSDAAGTTQSTVDGNKSTVTIQNADGLTDAVRDGAGNENGSVATATTSANTIKSGSKANTVISTADGTTFINSEAAAPVTGESGAGTAVNTTIKGNTITTGKVTMDYAEVMKDLGVHGNANITGKTTTGSLEVKGESKLTGKVTMESDATVGGKLDVTGKATFSDDVDIKKNLSVDGNATIKGDVTAKSYKVGDKTYISAAGINANDQKITNVADGSISEGSKDAVNGGQLYTVKNDLEGKVNKVGANAAAMANLHPMEFDPDSKWNIAAAIGNYGSETAAALGAFYRPNDDVMVNLSTAFGTGENMVGGGVSVRLGKGGNKLSREENNALKDQVDDLTARMDALLSVLNPNMSKDFPDVPENHWAYEAVSRLAGNDIVQGYPDGEFHGERTMTRYEMAEIIYNALSRGAEAEKELVEEFKPELQAMAASEKATAEKSEG